MTSQTYLRTIKFRNGIAGNNSVLGGGGNALSTGSPAPQTECAPNQVDLMLANHDEFNEISEKGLRDWQLHVCNDPIESPLRQVSKPSALPYVDCQKVQSAHMSRSGRTESENHCFDVLDFGL